MASRGPGATAFKADEDYECEMCGKLKPKGSTVYGTDSGTFCSRQCASAHAEEAASMDARDGIEPAPRAAPVDRKQQKLFQEQQKLHKEMSRVVSGAGRVISVNLTGSDAWEANFDTEYAALKAAFHYRRLSPNLVKKDGAWCLFVF